MGDNATPLYINLNDHGNTAPCQVSDTLNQRSSNVTELYIKPKDQSGSKRQCAQTNEQECYLTLRQSERLLGTKELHQMSNTVKSKEQECDCTRKQNQMITGNQCTVSNK